MLEILQFIFSSFWIWLGTVVLALIAAETVASPVRVITAFMLSVARRD